MSRVGALCIVLLIAFFASAEYSSLEADSLYQTAERSYRSGLYQNALASAYLSKEAYGAIGQRWGVDKCDKLIGEIGLVLTPTQLADTYYGIAGEYFTRANKDTFDLSRAIMMAQEAKKIYASIGGTVGSSGILKCEDLINEASQEINDNVNSCIREGDDLYAKAQNSFFSDYYVTAKIYASNASARYLACPYQTGVDKSALLLSSINAKIDEIRTNAKASYDKAIQYYTAGDTKLCIQYAGASQGLYTSIDDSEGYSAATMLLSRCKETGDRWEQGMKKQAQAYSEEAKRFSLIGDCFNATDRASKAKSIYQQLRDLALQREGNLPKSQQYTVKLYDTYIGEVNALMSKIQDTCSAERMLIIAETYYRTSQEYYLQLNLNEALSYANSARNIFFQLKNYVGVSKSDTLIEQIKMVMRQRSEAESLVASAKAFSMSANFDEALVDASRAGRLYSDMHDNDNTEKVGELVQAIRDGMDKLDSANKNFNKALNYLQASDYGNTLTSAEAANKLYVEVNYTIGVDESKKVIDTSREELDKQSSQSRNTMILIGVIGIVAVFLALQYLRSKRVMETDLKTRSQQGEEDMRRRNEELSLRVEEDTKSKVDDELRRLIEAERGKLEEK
ncbi:MAG: hypothetical protein V1744_05645 [Candidatus Altiarchaeota archaeon]